MNRTERVVGWFVLAIIFAGFALLILAGCNPFPPLPVTPDEALCSCPDLALAHHPNDPDSPGGCKARSRTGVVMDAGDHPACGREARERAGREG